MAYWYIDYRLAPVVIVLVFVWAYLLVWLIRDWPEIRERVSDEAHALEEKVKKGNGFGRS